MPFDPVLYVVGFGSFACWLGPKLTKRTIAQSVMPAIQRTIFRSDALRSGAIVTLP